MKQNIKVSATDKVLLIETLEKTFSYEWHSISPRLAKATKTQRSNLILSPSGYGIYWPDVDEDLSIPALLRKPAYQKTQRAALSANESKTAYNQNSKKKR